MDIRPMPESRDSQDSFLNCSWLLTLLLFLAAAACLGLERVDLATLQLGLTSNNILLELAKDVSSKDL